MTTNNTNTNMNGGQHKRTGECTTCGSTDALLWSYSITAPQNRMTEWTMHLRCGDCGNQWQANADDSDVYAMFSHYRLPDGTPATSELDEMGVSGSSPVPNSTGTGSGSSTTAEDIDAAIEDVDVDAEELVKELEETVTVGGSSDTDEHEGPLAPGERVAVEHPSNPLTIWRPGTDRAYRAEPADDPATDKKPFDISEDSVAYHLEEYDYERVDDDEGESAADDAAGTLALDPSGQDDGTVMDVYEARHDAEISLEIDEGDREQVVEEIIDSFERGQRRPDGADGDEATIPPITMDPEPETETKPPQTISEQLTTSPLFTTPDTFEARYSEMVGETEGDDE